MIDTLMVLGATGDLTGRLLLPAVTGLQAAGVLGSDFRFIGVGEQAWSRDDYRSFVRDRCAQHAPDIAPAEREALVAQLRYRHLDVADPTGVADGLNRIIDDCGPVPLAVYLALPTQLMLNAVEAVAQCRLPDGSRVAVEKPFGHDLASATGLNTVLRRLDDSPTQSSIYRVDHALAMTAVQNLPHARVPQTGRAITWDAERIERIELLWEETLALEGRAAFYDRAGALRDVMQNHLLQVLCTIAQPQHPAATDTRSAARRRSAVLNTVRPLDPTAMRTRTRRGRYTSGQLAGAGGGQSRAVPDYEAEDGVDPRRQTETFAEVILELDSDQWAGTPFVLRAGKALAARRRGVQVHFRPASARSTDVDRSAWFDLDETDQRNDDAAGGGPAVPADAEHEAYRRIVDDLLSGGSAYAVGAAEAESSWRIFDPVLQAWSDDAVPMLDYPAGSAGPPATGTS